MTPRLDAGQPERRVQNRIIKLLEESLGYRYLGDWQKRENNRAIEAELLRPYLERQGYGEALISRAIEKLSREATVKSGEKLYFTNKAVYGLLRYGVKVQPNPSEPTQTVWLIDWETPENNDFAFAEEVKIIGPHQNRRPDLVFYLNGIAVGVLELKKSTVSVVEGMQQCFGNQSHEDGVPDFFATQQLLMAGNDTQGLRYGTVGTPPKYYLEWEEEGRRHDPTRYKLDQHLELLLDKRRFLELLNDFVVFDSGTKKLCRHNQYFGVKAAQDFVRRRAGGVIWHTQGSGKSLTMVWLARWIRERVHDARVLIITDRKELDEQIEKVFNGVNEAMHRTKSGRELLDVLSRKEHSLICSLVHKFGAGAKDDPAKALEALLKEAGDGFRAQGNLHVFVDECHRTQSGKLHEAMKKLLPEAVFIGFTGTPLLKKDKATSLEVFGPYIHTYKFNQAVADGVVLDLRYEARDIDQRLVSPDKVDFWFDKKTQGMTDYARRQVQQRWGTLRNVLSARSRLEQIALDIMLDFERRPRLSDGRGNAMLVAGSIYEACQLYKIFAWAGWAGKCAVVTSYDPATDPSRDKTGDEGEGDSALKYRIYRKMLADFFKEPEETALRRVEEFETEVKRLFIEQPGQMRLLIVVDKLLTGFDAPPATYLYIDKKMQDHGLFQAICRVNRLDGEGKDYGYIIDYKDLFHSLETAIQDYTSGAFDEYDPQDVAGLLKDRLKEGRRSLEETREQVKALSETVPLPRDTLDYIRHYFNDDDDDEERLRKAAARVKFYQITGAFIRAYANIANEMAAAGFTPEQAEAIAAEAAYYGSVRQEVKMASVDYVDMKLIEPDMRRLINDYIKAEESQILSTFEDMTLVDLIAQRGEEAIDGLPEGIKGSEEAVAETIENNLRKTIRDEWAVNPEHYERMSALLATLIEQRREEAIAYREYLEGIVRLTRQMRHWEGASDYPPSLDTPAKRSLYDNLGKDKELALRVDAAVKDSKQHDWIGHTQRERAVKRALNEILRDDQETDRIFELVKAQHEYR